MSENQLEQLLNEKAGMEDEGRDLEEEQRQLQLRAKALVEKIIQELKKKNNEKHQVVNQLQSKIGALESQLSSLAPAKAAEKETVPEKVQQPIADAGATEEPVQAFVAETEVADEGNVTVAEVIEEGMEEDLEARQERKKHKFF